jgi:hypothetical protein
MEAGIAAGLHCRRPQAGSFARPCLCPKACHPGREAPRPLPGRCLRIPSATDASCIRAGSCRRGRAALVPAAGLAAMGGRFSFVSGHRPRVEPRKARRRTDPRGSEGSALRSAFAVAGPFAPGGGRALAARYARWRHRCTRLTDLSGHTSSLRRARMIPCGRLKRVLSRSGLWRKTPEFIGLRFRFRVAFPFDKPMLRLRSESRKRKPWKLSTGDRFCGGQLEPAPSERPVFVS